MGRGSPAPTETSSLDSGREGSGVLTQVAAAGRAVGAALEPVHHVLQVPAVAASLAPHKQSLHYVVAHCTYTGTLVAP